MPVPNANSGYVPPEKLLEYLLNTEHPIGGGKARWFISMGYDAAHPERLEHDLLLLLRDSDDFFEIKSPFGTKYVISGTIESPGGRQLLIRSVWIVEPSDNRPRFVTAFPGDLS